MNIFDIFSDTGVVCEGISVVIAFIFYKKWKNTIWKLFPFYLLLIFSGEFIGDYLMTHKSVSITNQQFYTLVMNPLQYLFIMSMFYKYQKAGRGKAVLPLACVWVYAFCFLTDIFYLQKGQYAWGSFADACGDMLLLILILRHFYLFIFSDNIVLYKTDIMFWFCTGVLLFYVGSLPLDALRNVLASKYYSVFETYWFISITMSCIMYLLFSIGIIWGKQK
jgi:hypothetical protein